MGLLVEDLLLARLDAGRPLSRCPVDLAGIAAEAVQRAPIVHPGRPITLRAAEPVIVHADDERVRQVIENLIGNAIQHTPDGSPVTVQNTPGSGELTVADTGPGMTAEQAAACSSGSTGRMVRGPVPVAVPVSGLPSRPR
jgi:two-component system OmpR family sensor kinase